MFSLIWWIIGFYWVSAGGNSLTHDAPQLYWFCSKSWLTKLFFFVSTTFYYFFPLLTISFLVTCLQALYSFSGIWCVLCGVLCTLGMPHWTHCLLLSSLFNSYSVCCGRSGMLSWLHTLCQMFKECYYLYALEACSSKPSYGDKICHFASTAYMFGLDKDCYPWFFGNRRGFHF